MICALPSLQALFLQGACAQISTLSGGYLHRIINSIPFCRPCVNFSAVKSVWINNTPSHIHQCEIGSYAPGYKKVAKKYEEKKIMAANGTENMMFSLGFGG